MAFGFLKRLGKSALNAATGPLRAVGKLARGDLRGAGGALGDVVKPAAFVLGATGVGAPLAAGVGALGGALQKLDDPGAKFGDYVKGAAGGASVGLAGGAARGVAQGIGRIAAGGAGGPSGAMMGAAGMPTPAMASIPGVAAQTVPQIAGPGTLAGTVGSTVAREGAKHGILPSIGGYLAKKPEVGLGLLQAGVGAYGAKEEGAARDREIDLAEQENERREQERQRRFKLDQIGQLMQAMASFRPRF